MSEIMRGLLEKHIQLVEAVNNSKTQREHDRNGDTLNGFREALEALHIRQLMDCDYYYLDQGVDRPMCCGVFLDWEPDTQESS